MSRKILFDIETTPQSEDHLLALMPPEIANPVMPEELKEIGQVDLTKCPAYGGDEEKKKAWREEQVRKAKEKHEKAISDWKLKAMDGKAKFIGDAALYAERGQTKLFSMRERDLTVCTILDASPEEKAAIKAKKDWPCRVDFNFMTEPDGLKFFHNSSLQMGSAHKAQLTGFYLVGFDFPFLIRRQMILGLPVSRHLMKTPRYFDEDFYIDLHEAWTLGDKQTHTGGLDGLAQILGVKRKTGTGEGFWRMWRDEPVAAILYHLHELDTIQQCAEKMGV